MADKYLKTANKLRTAIQKRFGVKIMLCTNQWFSPDKDRAITCYILKEATWDSNVQKYVNTELYRAYSTVRITLYLRDYWYELNGWEVPTDNVMWEGVKNTWQHQKANP